MYCKRIGAIYLYFYLWMKGELLKILKKLIPKMPRILTQYEGEKRSKKKELIPLAKMPPFVTNNEKLAYK